jgi:hypothetical protein
MTHRKTHRHRRYQGQWLILEVYDDVFGILVISATMIKNECAILIYSERQHRSCPYLLLRLEYFQDWF